MDSNLRFAACSSEPLPATQGQRLKNLLKAFRHPQSRIRRLSLGNVGDIRPVGEGVSELRIHYGPGYQFYLKKQGDALVILLTSKDYYI